VLARSIFYELGVHDRPLLPGQMNVHRRRAGRCRAVVQFSVGLRRQRADCRTQQGNKKGPLAQGPQPIESNDLSDVHVRVGASPRGSTARPATRRCRLGIVRAIKMLNVAAPFGSSRRKTPTTRSRPGRLRTHYQSEVRLATIPAIRIFYR
jgi:hypothetical protein